MASADRLNLSSLAARLSEIPNPDSQEAWGAALSLWKGETYRARMSKGLGPRGLGILIPTKTGVRASFAFPAGHCQLSVTQTAAEWGITLDCEGPWPQSHRQFIAILDAIRAWAPEGPYVEPRNTPARALRQLQTHMHLGGPPSTPPILDMSETCDINIHLYGTALVPAPWFKAAQQLHRDLHTFAITKRFYADATLHRGPTPDDSPTFAINVRNGTKDFLQISITERLIEFTFNGTAAPSHHTANIDAALEAAKDHCRQEGYRMSGAKKKAK